MGEGDDERLFVAWFCLRYYFLKDTLPYYVFFLAGFCFGFAKDIIMFFFFFKVLALLGFCFWQLFFVL